MSRLLGALRFLTSLPVRRNTAPPGECAIFFPILGAGIGWLTAAWLPFFDRWFGGALAALLTLALMAILTRASGEHGVLRSIGVVTLVFLILLRWQALMRIPGNGFAELAACMALSRGAMIAAVWITRPRDDGFAEQFSSRLTTLAAVASMGIAFAAAFLTGIRSGIVLLVATVASMSWLHRWFETQVDGIDEDGLCAIGLIVETLLMVLVTCRNCPWWSWQL